MKKEEISEIIGNIDEKYVEEASTFAPAADTVQSSVKASAVKPKERKKHRIVWIAAACILLTAVVSSTVFIMGAEAKEYNAALAFFEGNGLSTEGLSRSEIKAVYRDIETRSFSFGKTADVILRAVPGWEITQDEPTPGDLAAIWDRNVWNAVPKAGFGYRKDYRYVFDEKKGYEIFKKSIVECYRDGELLWTAEFSDFCVEGCAHTPNGTAVWGIPVLLSSLQTSYSAIARVDDNGSILWNRRLSHGFGHDSIATVLDDEDGTWAVILRGDLKYLCLCRLDIDGNELSFAQTEIGNLGVRNAAKLGDGYIVQVGNTITRDTARLIRMDRDGNLIDDFSYEGENCEYYLTDMIEFGGRVFLSAYSVPLQTDKGGRHEIANILDKLISNGMNISDEELTPLVRDNYTAVLLVCDPTGREPQAFYSVKGSLGGSLSVNEKGQLNWDVESVVSTFFSPATSSFTIGGTCKVFRYTFDRDGALISQNETDETVAYRR